MIDHLLKAVDEATLIAAIGSHLNLHHAATADGPAGWRADIAFPCQVTDNTNPNSPVLLTDFHLWVALPAQDATLCANAGFLLAADRDAANAGNPNFVLQTTMTQAQMNVYTISPVIMGSNYPFGSV